MTDEDTSLAPEPATAPSKPPEAATASEVAPVDVPEIQTAQIPAGEPLAPTPEPVDSAQDKPLPAPTASTPTVVTTITHAARDLLVKARAAIQNRKHIKLEKILSEVAKKGKITNDEVEKLLHVSDATATRYLSALVKEGKIKQIGKTGKAVEYTRI